MQDDIEVRSDEMNGERDIKSTTPGVGEGRENLALEMDSDDETVKNAL